MPPLVDPPPRAQNSRASRLVPRPGLAVSPSRGSALRVQGSPARHLKEAGSKRMLRDLARASGSDSCFHSLPAAPFCNNSTSQKGVGGGNAAGKAGSGDLTAGYFRTPQSFPKPLPLLCRSQLLRASPRLFSAGRRQAELLTRSSRGSGRGGAAESRLQRWPGGQRRKRAGAGRSRRWPPRKPRGGRSVHRAPDPPGLRAAAGGVSSPGSRGWP